MTTLDEANLQPPEPISGSPTGWPSDPEIGRHEPRNLLLLAAHQIVFRIGWVFKTEGVIIPAFLDLVAGAGWLRGCLPVLTRLGQSVPPVLWAGRLRSMRHKRQALAGMSFLLSIPFLVLSVICLMPGTQPPRWLAGLFLGVYFVFFVGYGLYLLAFGTIQGKLIQPTRRGRLLLLSTFGGLAPAMLFAWWLLGDWLARPDGGFGQIFGFVSACFFLSGLLVLPIHEPADAEDGQTPSHGSLADTWRALRADIQLRRLAVVAMLFGTGMIIVPHYQALARQRLGLDYHHLMFWVLTQNASVGLLSLLVGPMADGRGNLITLRTLVFGSAIAPLFAISLPHLSGGLGATLFWIVFIPLGISPLLTVALMNYTLEICPARQHPLYLSTVNLCLTIPFLFSPLAGWLIDATGFEAVFLTTAFMIAISGGLTFGLVEPRRGGMTRQ